MQWTLEELADRAARALTDADIRVANGRVTGVPDGRLIRYYSTLGLVDRPSVGPGRAARYGEKHLLQLVAVKRLQAEGLPLVEIQQRLVGATDEMLRRLADLPPVSEASLSSAARPRFWAARPSPAPDVHPHDTVEPVHGVRLSGLTLLLPFAPSAEDRAAIAAAAQPLLDLLAVRGLLEPIPTEGSSS